ncbi:PLP-dependent cysteine synthase family protein [Streptomyces sp. SL13]|uniref:PLP-dependent cysteine synthase family protein n=1 Tax=Streptantibioticus silvisoli TaxID=2705255 RepID=A0AA90JX94_9ACTN|nr:PLP-dependent cysteine synthase family protein [Streptantibioticus silvisoli]MDI5969881.1 PLP-dependent cysteine synthase family protein [Streptantibioticus silvisoli]
MSVTERAKALDGTDGDDLSDRYRDERDWVAGRIELIRDLPHVETPLIEVPLPPKLDGLRLCVKNESVHPSGSHKHRLAEALFTHALASGWLRSDGPVVEASSGSTAISEAWFCQKLDLAFAAVVPSGTSEEKKDTIRDLNGNVIEAPPGADLCEHARQYALKVGGHFMDQFTYAERAYDWRGEHGLAPELIGAADPDWFVMGAGTGGTVTSVGRYARNTGSKVRVCVTDPENSAFFAGWRDDNPKATDKGSRIEGIGRPRVEPSFLFPTVNRMIRVHDAASVATMRVAADHLGFRPGPSTGTGLFGALRILHEMQDRGERGTVATLMCDDGSRYNNEYYNNDWCKDHGIDFEPWLDPITEFFETGDWQPPTTFDAAPRPSDTLWNM